MKDIGTLLQFPKHEGAELKQNEDGSFVYKIAENIAMTRQQKINKEVINFLYQAYKDTDVSKIYVLDMEQFEKFLKETLPLWQGKAEGVTWEEIRDAMRYASPFKGDLR